MSEVIKRKNTSIFTKGQVYTMLVNFAEEIKPLKPSKQLQEKLADLIRVNTPQARGRRRTIDFAALQDCVDEAGRRVSGGDASTLVAVAAACWNVREENSSNLVDSQRMRTYVEKGKLTLPDGITFPARRKRVAKVTIESAA